MPNASNSPPAKAPRRDVSSSRPRNGERDALRLEVSALTETLVQLRADHNTTVSFAAEDAAMQRHKRMRAQEENLQLREALLVQSRFVEQLKAMCVAAPVVHVDSNWHDLLHSYTRLPADESLRRAEFRALTTESRLRYAMRRLEMDTQPLLDAQPCIYREFSPLHTGLAGHTPGVYALDTTDIYRALRAVCVAIRDITCVWPEYERTNLDRTVLDTAATASCPLLYGVDTVSYNSGATRGSELVLVQSRVVTFYTVIDGCGLVMWDFVDEDELQPVDARVDVQRCAVGACLLRVEQGKDGEDRMVCSKKFLRHGGRESKVDRLLSSVEAAVKSNGTVFKDIVMQQVAEEEMLLSIAQSAC